MKKTALSLALMALLALTGCANRNQLYDWGGYDGMLYQQYKDPAKAVEMRTKLEAHVTQLEKSKQKVPPGIYAEIGTLYLQANDRKKSVDYYQREAAAWPESTGLMNAMIATINRQDTVTEVGASTK
jgi:hypothetical protein